eukprot:RCo013547
MLRGLIGPLPPLLLAVLCCSLNLTSAASATTAIPLCPCGALGNVSGASEELAGDAATLCVGVRCISKHRRSLTLLLHSLLVSGSGGLRVFLVDTGKPPLDLAPYAALANARCRIPCEPREGPLKLRRRYGSFTAGNGRQVFRSSGN